MRKVTYLAIVLYIFWGRSFSTPILADQPPPQYRIGIGLAGEYLNSDARLKIIPDNEIELGKIGLSQSQVAKRLQAAFCGEFGATMARHYYLGLLVSWRHSGAHNISNGPIRGANFFSHEFKINHYTDVMLKPAYKLTPCFMIYGLAGPSIANWRHTTSQSNGNHQTVNTFKTNKTSLGVGFGLGCEYFFKKKYALSIDYTYHFFASASKNQTISYFDPTIGDIRTGDLVKKVQPSFGTIAIRFSMFFQL